MRFVNFLSLNINNRNKLKKNVRKKMFSFISSKELSDGINFKIGLK